MALLSILFQDQKVKTIIGSITLDASVNESHELASEATTNPVESGSQITDHIFTQPERLFIEGVVTDSPIVVLGQSAVIEGSATQALGAWQALRQLWASRSPFSVITGLQAYTSMYISRLTVPRNVRTGAALRFSIELQRIEIVKSQVVAIPKESLAEDEQDGASSQDVGSQSTDEPTADQEESASIAYKALYGD